MQFPYVNAYQFNIHLIRSTASLEKAQFTDLYLCYHLRKGPILMYELIFADSQTHYP